MVERKKINKKTEEKKKNSNGETQNPTPNNNSEPKYRDRNKKEEKGLKRYPARKTVIPYRTRGRPWRGG